MKISVWSGVLTAMQLQFCIAERWSPQIGDPNLTGWLTVLAYLSTALLSVAAWYRMARQPRRMFWAILVILLIILAINKQLDIQSALTIAGKCLATAQGWYANRRIVQASFIAVLITIILIGLVIAMFSLRGVLFSNLFALLGLATVLSFVMVRAVSIHHFDYFIGAKNFGISNNFLLENFGLILMGTSIFDIFRSRVAGSAA